MQEKKNQYEKCQKQQVDFTPVSYLLHALCSLASHRICEYFSVSKPIHTEDNVLLQACEALFFGGGGVGLGVGERWGYKEQPKLHPFFILEGSVPKLLEC